MEELTLLEGESLVDVVVAAAVAPGANASTDRLSLPPMKAVRVEEVTLDGRTYFFLQFPSETVTNSGCAPLRYLWNSSDVLPAPLSVCVYRYNIKRRNFVVASMKGRTVYSLCASARSDQYSEAKGEQLATIVQSFRVR